MDEASRTLYGSGGIVLNSHEYYQEVVSRFVQKKEHIIKKQDGNLVFDLDDMNDMWNIVFIAEYVKQKDELYRSLKELEQEIEIGNNKKNEILNNLRNESANLENSSRSDRKEKLKSYVDELNRCREDIKENEDKLNSYKKTKEAFESYDWVRLNVPNGVSIDSLTEEEIALFKQAVHIIHGLRNANEHGGAQDGKHVLINDGEGHFQVKIPIEYLDGFSKGRIIANEEDHVVVETTNKIMSPLLKSLDYDISKLNSFFYNVNPAFLSMLLDMYNNDISKLYKLPLDVFSLPQPVCALLNEGIDILRLPDINRGVIVHADGIIQLHKAGIDVYRVSLGAFQYPEGAITLHKAGIDIYRLPANAFEYPEGTIKLYQKVADKEVFYGIPEEAFSYADNVIRLIDKNVIKKEKIADLSIGAFKYPKGTKKLHKARIDIYKLSANAFKYPKGTIKLHKAGIDIYRLSANAFKYSKGTIKLSKKVVDKDFIYKVSECASNEDDVLSGVFEYSAGIIKLKNEGIDINNVSEAAFRYPENAIDLYKAGIKIDRFVSGENVFKYAAQIKRLKDKGVDVDSMKERNLSFMTERFTSLTPQEESQFVTGLINNIIRLHGEKINVSNLPEEAFKYPESVIYLKNAGIDIYHLSGVAFRYPDSVKKLHEVGLINSETSEEVLAHADNVIRLIDANVIKAEDIDRVLKLLHPANARRFYKAHGNMFEYPDGVIKLHKAGIDVFRLPSMVLRNFDDVKYDTNLFKLKDAKVDIYCVPKEAFEYPDNVIKLFETRKVNIYKLPYRAIRYPDNVVRLLELVDYQYERLKEFPEEFFYCDSTLLEEMFQSYNYNVAKSVFGINNPKIIAAMVYANSVMKHYQKENSDGDCVSLDPRRFILNCCGSTLYSNNYSKLVHEPNRFKFGLAEYIGQFYGISEMSESSDKLKKFILDKIRNSAAHFRIKPVKNNSGDVVEDKICFYDKSDELSDPNFFAVMDIQEFVEMIHGIEQDLQFRQPVVTTSNSDSTGGMTR